MSVGVDGVNGRVGPESAQQVPFTVRVHLEGNSPTLMDKAVVIRPLPFMKSIKNCMWSSFH